MVNAMTLFFSAKKMLNVPAIYIALFSWITVFPPISWGFDLSFVDDPVEVDGQRYILDSEQGTLVINGVTAVCDKNPSEPLPAGLLLTVVLQRGGSAVTTHTTQLNSGWNCSSSSHCVRPVSYTYSLPEPGFMDYNLRSADNYDFQLTLAADGTEANTDNNILSSQQFAYTVFSGKLFFGAEQTTLLSLTFSGTQYIDPYLYPVLGSSTATWDGEYGSLAFNGSGLVVRVDDQQYGFTSDLTVIQGEIVFDDINQSGIGGLTVHLASTALTPAGVVDSSPSLELPPGHSAHFIDGNGEILAAGHSSLTFSQSTHTENGLEVDLPPIALHGPGLPFYLKIAAQNNLDILNGDSLDLSEAQIVYVQQGALTALAPDDTRTQNGLPDNDIMFSRGSSASAGLTSGGLNGTVSFAGNSNDSYNNRTSFPLGSLGFSSFTVQLADSTIVSGSGLAEPLFSLAVAPGCPDSACSEDLPEDTVFTVGSAGAGMLANGAVGSRFDRLHGPTISETASPLEWGYFVPGADDQLHGTFIRDDKVGGVWVLPGFILNDTADETVSLPEALLGSATFSAPDQPSTWHTLHAAEDTAAVEGNGFFAGLNLGPETFTNADPGVGTLLDADMEIRFFGNSIHVSMSDQQKAKYVVRRGGITGVFNTTFTGSANVYSYDLAFSRFSFRQDRNRIDNHTLIDGELILHGNVGGDEGMRVGFFDLDLMCNGSLGNGIIDSEPEPTWPLCQNDGDNDGRTDEGCHVLSYWHMPILMTGMSFVNNSEADADDADCPANPKLLQLQTMNQVDKLADPLQMIAAYTPEGNLLHQNLAGEVQTVLDKPVIVEQDEPVTELPGFKIRLQKAYLNQLTALAPDNGFTVIAGLVDVPLFNDVSVMTHVDNNTSANFTDGSLYIFGDDTDRDTDFDGLPNAEFYNGQGVEDFRGMLTNNEVEGQPLPQFHYFWPSTDLLDFSYYGRYSEASVTSEPKFKGIKKVLHIFNVIDANGVPDFITPEHTKFSFGASADFDAMKAAFAEVGNHIDGLNVFLAGLGVVGLDLEGMLAPMVDAMNDLHELTGGDLSSFLTDILEEPLVAGVGLTDVQNMAQEITQAHQALFDLESIIKSPVLAVQTGLEEILAGNFSDPGWVDDYAAVAFYGSDRLLELTDIPSGFDMNAARLRVEEFRRGLDQALDMTEEMLTTTSRTLRTLCDDDLCQQGMLAQIDNKLVIAETAITTFYGFLPVGFSSYLINDANNPIKQKINEAKGTISNARNKIQNFNIKSVLAAMQTAAMTAGVQLDHSLMSDTEKNLEALKQSINGLLDSLSQRIVQVEANFDRSFDETPVDEMLVEALQDLATLKAKITQAHNAVTEVKTRILYLTNEAPDRIDQIRSVLAMLRHLVDEDEPLPTDADWDSCMNRSKKQFDDAAKEMNRVWGGRNVAACATGENSGACFKAVFGPNVVGLAQWMTKPLLADDDLEDAFNGIINNITSALPLPTDKDITNMIVSAILDNAAVQAVNQAFYALYSPIRDELDDIATHVTMVVNKTITDLAAAVDHALGDALATLVPMGPEGDDNPLAMLSAAKMNGYALIGQDELERLHLDFEFKLKPDPKKPITFYVGFDVSAWGAENGKGGCDEGVAGDYYDVKISTRDVSAAMLGADVGIKQAFFGMTIAGTPPEDFPLSGVSPCPIGIFGGLYTVGGFDFKAMTLEDLGFELGFGTSEAYLGATGRGSFDSFSISMAAFYLGKSCDAGVITRLDKDVGNFIKLEENQPLLGAYVRGGVEIPLYTYGCPCEIGAGIDVGGWYFTKPKETFGGLLGGSLYGKLGCVGNLKGKILCMLEPSGDKVKYSGTAWAAAGVGMCSMNKWQTVTDVRADGPLCFTADTTFGVSYIDEFELAEPDVRCCN